MTEETKEEKDDITKAIDLLEKDSEKKSKGKSEDIKIPPLNSFKTNELSMTLNNTLAKNIDPKAGDCLLGENLVRTGEYYGLKSHPILALAVSAIGVILIAFQKLTKKKEKKAEGATLNDGLQNS